MPTYTFPDRANGEVIDETWFDPLQLAVAGLAENYVSFSFKTNDEQYFVINTALSLGTPVERGTGTLTYAKALSATPTSFTTISAWPTAFAAGDVLRVTSTGVSGYKAATLPRTA